MLAGPDGQAVKSEPKSEQQDKAANAASEDTERPMLGIDAKGNLTLCIPLHKTGEIFARGFLDVARTEVMKWFQAQAQKRREFEALATKTGFQRFKDKLLRR